MNYSFRSLWHELYKIASNDPQTTFVIAMIVVVGVGIMCLRGNVIKR